MRHVFVEKTLLEVVVACRHWSVAGVKLRAAYHLKSFVELKAFVLDEVSHALCTDEGSMTLVAVIDILLDAKLVEQHHAADAEQIFLLDAVLPVATIELVGDAAIPLGVAVDVGVEQIELHATDIHLPYVGINNDVVVERHFKDELSAILILHRLNGELSEVLGLVIGLLAAISRECLGEITETIEETYSTEINVGIRSLLHIVACEDAKTTRIDLETCSQAILHTEIGYRRTLGVDWLSHVVVEMSNDRINLLHELLVGHNLIETIERHGLEHSERVVTR